MSCSGIGSRRNDIPVPAGGFAGVDADIPDDAEVQVHPRSANGYYVVVNNLEPSNDQVADLFSELKSEGAIGVVDSHRYSSLRKNPKSAFKAAGLLAAVLVSVFTPSNLVKEFH